MTPPAETFRKGPLDQWRIFLREPKKARPEGVHKVFTRSFGRDFTTQLSKAWQADPEIVQINGAEAGDKEDSSARTGPTGPNTTMSAEPPHGCHFLYAIEVPPFYGGDTPVRQTNTRAYDTLSDGQ